MIIKEFADSRGVLMAINFSSMDFHPKRVFFVKDVPVGMVRGGHAHKTVTQVLICVKGEIEVILHTSENKYTKEIIYPGEWVMVPPMVWDTQKFLSEDALLAVLCSKEYMEDDYIRDWEIWTKNL
jgi:dTDP-4-dehydrorhamnose 3,5-epimerase-like enzyme